MRVCMFVKNSFEYDARVTKEAVSLIQAGHEVTVVAILVPRVTAERETTSDGIEVVRVSRAGMGLPAMSRLAQRFAVWTEVRRARLVGTAVDEERARDLGTWVEPETATPGDAQRAAQIPEIEPTKKGALSTTWGRVSSLALRIVIKAGRGLIRIAKKVLGRQSSRLKNWAIDRRMIRAGLGTGADIFHSHDLNTLKVGVACKKKAGAKLVYDSHELQTERSRMTPNQKRRALRLEGRLIGQADAFITASPPWIDWNRDLYGSVPEPAVDVLNTPELREIEPLSLHEELSLEPATRVIVYQGSVQEYRGIEPAIDAVQLIDDTVLVVIGYGYHRPTLEADVARRGLQDKVYFFGPIPNETLLRYTASADIGLCNIVSSSVSYDTCLPNKLFEYMMARVPVVGSHSPEIGRVIDETGVGVATDPEDPAALAAGAKQILADPGPFRAAMDDARAAYNWSVEEQKLLDVYATLD